MMVTMVVLISGGILTHIPAMKLAVVFPSSLALMRGHLCLSIAFVGLVLTATKPGSAFLLLTKPRSALL